MKTLFFALYLSALSFANSYLSFGGGLFNVLRQEQKTGMLQFEYKAEPFWGKKHLFIRPYVSAFATFEGSLYACAGFAFDVPLGKYAYMVPSFGSGFYYAGSGKDLGYPVENRSSLEMGAVFTNCSRLGVQFYHLSNGSISRKNPGTECLILVYSIELN